MSVFVTFFRDTRPQSPGRHVEVEADYTRSKQKKTLVNKKATSSASEALTEIIFYPDQNITD